MIARRIASAAALGMLLAAGSCFGPRVVGDGCEWVPPPPRPELCRPGQNPHVDENMIAECTALTEPMGTWLLEIDELGRENCLQSGW